MRKSAIALSLLSAGLFTACVTAQSQRQADIGPQTFPRAQPDSTPSADRPAAYPMPNKDPGVMPTATPRKGVPSMNRSIATPTPSR